MTKMIFCCGLLAVFGVQLAIAQECDDMESIPGEAILIIDAALPEFRNRELDLSEYSINLIEKAESTVVMFLPDDTELSDLSEQRGSGAKLTFEVEVARNDLRVIRANFAR